MTQRSIIPAAVLAAVAAAPCLAPGAVSAQNISSPYDFVETSQSIQAYGGYIFADRGVIQLGPGSAPTGGLGYSIRVSGPFVIDARIGYVPTSRTVYDVEPADSADVAADPMTGLVPLGTADLSLLVLDASLRFDFTGPRTWYRLQPFALIGVGGVVRVASDNAVEADLPTDIDLRFRFRNGFTGHVGGGVEWHFSRRLTLRAEARDRLWKLFVPTGFRQGNRLIASEEWVQTADLSLGLAFRF